jgi:putative radical SAM enzyme (TIGR03279 family)
MRIKAVDPQSPLFGRVHPGFTVKSVNGQPVLDAIDFRFKTSEERISIVFSDKRGREVKVGIDEENPGDLGLTLDDDRVRVCKNKCIFCFVHQQPAGMRRALYVKDEDYRLSFTHGNFVTLSSTTEQEIHRIITQRLSPLYVSVHATDEKLRRHLLGNRNIAPILPRLRHLTDNGITVHTQVVVCPGINDGEHLEKTINDLSALYPGVRSLGIVPVGLTRYRNDLPRLRKFQLEEAASLIDYIEMRQKGFLRGLGSRLVWPSDELYVETGRAFPGHSTYEDVPQFENGVGMAREFLTMFNRRRASLRRLRSRRRALFLTGRAAFPFMASEVLPFVTDRLRLMVSLFPVENRFWGKTVTVSGLLTGKDLLKGARSSIGNYDTLVLPPNCLNADGLFLDDLSLETFQRRLGKAVVVGRYNLAETLVEVFV